MQTDVEIVVKDRSCEVVGHCLDDSQHVGMRGGLYESVHHEARGDGVFGRQPALEIDSWYWIPVGVELAERRG
jgi:hypothetical protein